MTPWQGQRGLGGLLRASLSRFFGGGLGRGSNDFVAQLAVGHFVEGNVHKRHAGADRNHRAIAEAELAHAFGDHIN